MMKSKMVLRAVVSLLVLVSVFVPLQVSVCLAASSDAVLLPVFQEEAPGKEEGGVDPFEEVATPPEVPVPDEEEPFFSTGMKIGVGAAAAIALGVAVSSGGGSAASPAPVVPAVPPTADQLVDPWHVEGQQPGSGRSYTGTFHLYQGGALGYDLNLSDGVHLVGGGNWRLTEYLLQIYTDHGSLYSGSFVPGNITSVHLNANTGWTVTLSR